MGLQQEFQRQILEPSPPPPNMEVLPWEYDLDPDKVAARKPAVTVRTFCGTSGKDIAEWLSRWRRTVVVNRWNDEQELQMLSAFLDGAAGCLYDKQTDAVKNN